MIFAKGAIPTSEEEYEKIELATPEIGLRIPNKYELKDSFPPPHPIGQGKQGSCVAWAVAYALKTYQEFIQHGGNKNNSDFQFSPSFIYNQLNKSNSCASGLTTPVVLEFIKTNGVASLKDFPYDHQNYSCKREPNEEIKNKAKNNKINSYKKIDYRDTDNLKAFIANKYPILIIIKVFKEFEYINKNYYNYSTTDILSESPGCSPPYYHAVVITGYDDTRKSFRIMNSWGKEWGENGFKWITYSSIPEITREAYILYDA